MPDTPDTSASDHDQRLKVLLKEFFEQFFLCFFPSWASRFDFSVLSWLDKELFLAPPQGEKRLLDLAVQLRIRPDAPRLQSNAKELLAVIHVEVESGESSQPIKPRMLEYYAQLRRDTQLPVLPIVLFLHVGLEGIGWDAYEEYFWEHRLVSFQYAYVGLPALDAESFATGEHLLGVALSALMRVPKEKRAQLHADALKRIVLSGENDWRRFLLMECVEAYGDLDEEQIQRLQALLTTKDYEEVRPLMITTYERGKLEGKLEGKIEGKLEGKIEGKLEGKIEERRETALLLLEAKFDPLSAEVKQRVEALTAEQLRRLLLDLVKAQSLQELHLQD